MGEPGTDRRRAGRELAAVVGLGGVAAGLALLATGRTWSRLRLGAEGMPQQQLAVTGADAMPWLRAVALVALAALGAVLVTRGWSRRAVGALLCVCGGWLAFGSATGTDAVTAELQARAEATPAAADPAVARTLLALDAEINAWPWLVLASGLVLVLAGLGTVVRGACWPAMGRRYERPAEPHDVWRELDQGRDPTG